MVVPLALLVLTSRRMEPWGIQCVTGGVSRVHLAVGLRVRVRLREVDAVGLMDAHVLIDEMGNRAPRGREVQWRNLTRLFGSLAWARFGFVDATFAEANAG